MVIYFNEFLQDFRKFREYEKKASALVEMKYDCETWLNSDFKEKEYYDFKCSRGFFYEVKCDQRCKRTGNFYIEYESYNGDSGINVTKSDYYIICDTENYYMIPTEEIKTYIREKLPRTIACGNGRGCSRGYLVPMKEILPHAILL